jgi:hypothetical protein
MLQELLIYAATRCPPYARKMGFLHESVATLARYRRNRSSWHLHCLRTRQFVLSRAQRCRSRDTAFILGSGILADVPLEGLSDLFREVVLVDVVHLPAALKTARSFPNVRTLGLDVTGTAEKLFESSRNRAPSLPAVTPSFPSLTGEHDFVVSMNIMSQLPVIPERYIMKTGFGATETQVAAWCGQIVSTHWEGLSSLPCPACLVTDFSFRKLDRKNAVIETGGTIRGVALTPPDEIWSWEIAPTGELSRSYSMVLDVGAWNIG